MKEVTEVTFFRVISLTVIILAVGLAWFFIKTVSNSQDQDKSQLKKQAKEEAIRYSVVIGVIYMVVVLALGSI